MFIYTVRVRVCLPSTGPRTGAQKAMKNSSCPHICLFTFHPKQKKRHLDSPNPIRCLSFAFRPDIYCSTQRFTAVPSNQRAHGDRLSQHTHLAFICRILHCWPNRPLCSARGSAHNAGPRRVKPAKRKCLGRLQYCWLNVNI